MKIRKVIQLLFFLLILVISVGHTLEESGISIPLVSSASLHAVCPFGGVVSIYEYFVSGRFVKKVHESSFILMFIVLGLTVFLGPVFCGWICPFGTFQEWVGKLGRKIFKKRFNRFIPYSVDKYLRFFRYIVLVLIVVKTAQSALLLFERIDPYYALFNIWSDEVATAAYISLGVVTLLSFFVERPFCKYACPYGALLGITNLFRPVKIKRIASTCISCKICDNKCPMNIPLSEAGDVVDHQCISCLECTSEASCPKDDTMVFALGKRVLKSKQVAIITVLIFIIGVGGSMALDLWKTESSKVPVKIKAGDFAGQSNPEDIRGSYSLGDVEAAFDVPVSVLVKAFALNEVTNPSSFQIKEMEGRYIAEEGKEIGTGSIRIFVALYKSMPVTISGDDLLLKPAYAILKDIIPENMKETIEGIIIDVPKINSGEVEHDDVKVPAGVLEIKGNTTFKDVMAMGITEEEIISILGSKPTRYTITIKDYAVENGLEFSTIKEALLSR